MSITIECDNCHSRFKVAEKYAGRNATCASCGSRIVIPMPEDTEEPGLPPLDMIASETAPPRAASTDQAFPQNDQYAPDDVNDDDDDENPWQTVPPPGGAAGADTPDSTFWRDLISLACPIQGLSDFFIFIILIVLSLFLVFPVFGALVFVGKILVTGYFYAYMFAIIVETAAGQDELPDMPGVTSIWEDVLRPFFLVIASGLYAFLPAIIVLIIYIVRLVKSGGDTPDQRDIMEAIMAVPILLVLFIGGLFVWPMIMLGLALSESLSVVRPDLVIRSIIGTIGPYIVCCVCILLSWVAWVWAEGSFVKNADGSLGTLLIAGLLSQIGGLCIWIYAMRAMGLLYRHYKHRLAWTFE